MVKHDDDYAADNDVNVTKHCVCKCRHIVMNMICKGIKNKH